MTKPNWVRLSDDEQEEIDRVVLSPGWRLIRGAELPSAFPSDFRAKIDSAVVVAAPTSTGGTYLAYSANRVDYNDQQIDIEPFGLIVHSTGPSSSGVFLHHGSWEARSEPLPAGFWDAVSESGIGDYFHSNPPAGLREGTLEQLPKGHSGAFDALVREIRTRIDGRKK
jgi:hypothetical protein